MFHVNLSTKILAALGVLLGLFAAQLSFSVAHAAPYPPRAETTTDLRLDKSRVNPGESNTARVTVSSGAGTPQGWVTFKVSGYQAERRPLVNGEASYSLPTDMKAGKTYKVTARYAGTKRVYRPSSDAEYVTVSDDSVAGSEGSANRPGTGGDVLGDAANAGALPSVGSDSTTQVFALGGLGLLAAGAVSLLMYRRRVRA